MRKKVCIVGAGPSGLTTVKQLLDEKHDVTCFEKHSDIGGLFNSQLPTSNIYENAVLTISNYTMAFSDFPPKGPRIHWHHNEYMEYLREYVKHFGLSQHIRLNTEIVSIQKISEGNFIVVVKNNITGEIKEEQYEAVAICSGTHRIKNYPAIPGLDAFSGQLSHSSEYRTNKEFVNKRVLCIGIGESAADIVREISEVSTQCYLGIRSYPLLVPRILNCSSSDSWVSRMFHSGKHASESWISYVLCLMMYPVYHVIQKLLVDKTPHYDAFHQPVSEKMIDLNTPFSGEVAKLIMAWRELSEDKKFATKNVTFVPNIINGKIIVNASGIESVKGNTVYFKDGRQIEVDAIVACTGYKEDFSFIYGVKVEDNNVRNLFMHAFHPENRDIAFIGWARPVTGGIPACSEMQARYFALLLNNKRSFPSNIYARIEADKLYYAEALKNAKSLNTVVIWKRYLETLAELIGCKVNVLRYIFNPKLFLKIMYGSLIPVQYRLAGQHANPRKAKETILNLPITLPHDLNWMFTLNAVFTPFGVKEFSPAGNQAKWFYKEDLTLDERGLKQYRFVHEDKK